MRRSLGVWFAVLLLLSGCVSRKGLSDLPQPVADPGIDKSKLSRELNVYNWTEYLPEEVLEQFQQLYGVKVNYDTYSNNEELHAKLKAGGSGYDVIFPSDYMIPALRRDGLLQPIEKANVPNLVNIDARFKGLPFDPEGEVSVPYMWGTTGILINTSEIDADDVKGWSDLWKPAFKGQLVVPDDAREVVGLALLAGGEPLNSTDSRKLEAAKQRLVQLKPNIKAFNSDSPKDLLLGGEVAAGVIFSGEAAKVIQENDSFRYILPAEGATIWMDSMAIPTGAQHKYTAEVFINFLLSPEVSARLSLAFLYGNPNGKARDLLPDFYRENPALNPSEEALKKAHWFDDLGDEGNQIYDRIWTELKG